MPCDQSAALYCWLLLLGEWGSGWRELGQSSDRKATRAGTTSSSLPPPSRPLPPNSLFYAFLFMPVKRTAGSSARTWLVVGRSNEASRRDIIQSWSRQDGSNKAWRCEEKKRNAKLPPGPRLESEILPPHLLTPCKRRKVPAASLSRLAAALGPSPR